MTHDHLQFVSITFDDSSTGIMAFHLAPHIDGKVEDTLPGYNKETKTREATDEAIQHEIDKSAYSNKPISWRRIAFEDLPEHREYRNAWKDFNTHIDHDMDKAKEIHRNKLRTARASLLAKLDTDYMKADEEGDNTTKKAVAAKKKLLRDVPGHTDIDKATTVSQLKQLTLKVLTGLE